MAGAPYRAPHEAAARRLRVFPAMSLRVVPLILFFGLLPPGLFLFLWSRVVTVECSVLSRDVVSCEVHEDTLVTQRRRHVALQAPLRADFAGDTEDSRGYTWIEVQTSTGAVQLTSGFNAYRIQQRELAAALTQLFRSAPGASHRGGYGSRWLASPVPILCMAVAMAFWLFWGQSMTFLRRGSPPALAVETRRWPLPARRYSFELREVAAAEIGPHPQSRVPRLRQAAHLVLRTVGGERVVLGLVDGKRGPKVQARVAAFLRQA